MSIDFLKHSWKFGEKAVETLALFGFPQHFSFRVYLAGHTVAMVTYFVMKRATTCSPIVGQLFDTTIAALSDKEWL